MFLRVMLKLCEYSIPDRFDMVWVVKLSVQFQDSDQPAMNKLKGNLVSDLMICHVDIFSQSHRAFWKSQEQIP